MAATRPSSHEEHVGIGSREHDLAGNSITNLRTSPDETAGQVPSTNVPYWHPVDLATASWEVGSPRRSYVAPVGGHLSETR